MRQPSLAFACIYAMPGLSSSQPQGAAALEGGPRLAFTRVSDASFQGAVRVRCGCGWGHLGILGPCTQVSRLAHSPPANP